MNVVRRHRPDVQISPYIELKHTLLIRGLLSCSQTGFHVAFDTLAELRERVRAWLAQREPAAARWDVPPLIRRDWVPENVWTDPPEAQWCREEPGGHLLTPVPLMHLLNYQRHHPVSEGTWRLAGVCVRDEAAEEMMPLLRQRTFTMLQYVRLVRGGGPRQWREELVGQLWAQAASWDLPVELATSAPDAPSEAAICLALPETPRVALSRAVDVPVALLAAYGLGEVNVSTLGSGVERWCLALLARHGGDPANWPLPSAASVEGDRASTG